MKSGSFKQVLSYANRITLTGCSILLIGESGTGKSFLAKYIHDNSQRKTKPFCETNCSVLNGSLLESELFGHERADSKKIGVIEAITGGTLHLKDIEDMSLRTQEKLLKALQEGEIYRIGSGKPIKVDIRLIASTNCDLAKEVMQGNFLESLYHHINPFTLELPPLKDRLEDLRDLIDEFNTQNKDFDIEALKCLMAYSWPGNIRELKNVIIRASILSSNNMITKEDLPEEVLNARFKTI
jgi:DNA-binding NtrC family response regulator